MLRPIQKHRAPLHSIVQRVFHVNDASFGVRAFLRLLDCRAKSDSCSLSQKLPYNCAQMKRALITGITGQDGSYLADLLLEKGYEVHGIIRRASTFNTSRIDHLYADPHVNGVRMFLHYGDLTDSVNLVKLLYELKPDEIYHLGAQSHVRVSFDIPEYTSDVTGVGTIRILEAIREAGVAHAFLSGLKQRNVRQGAAEFRKPRRHPSGREARTAWPRCSPIGRR